MSAVKISTILFTIAYVLANASSGQATQPAVSQYCGKATDSCQSATKTCMNITSTSNITIKLNFCADLYASVQLIVSFVQAIAKLQITDGDVLTILQTLLVFINLVLYICAIFQASISIGVVIIAIVGILADIKAKINLFISLCSSAYVIIQASLITLVLQLSIQLVVNVLVGVEALLELVFKLLLGLTGVTLAAVITLAVKVVVFLKAIAEICASITLNLVATIKISGLITGPFNSCYNQLESCNSQLISITAIVGACSVGNTSLGLLIQIGAALSAVITIVISLAPIIQVLVTLKIFAPGIVIICINVILTLTIQIGKTCQQCCQATTGQMSSSFMACVQILTMLGTFLSAIGSN